jgi:hypothetical protein
MRDWGGASHNDALYAGYWGAGIGALLGAILGPLNVIAYTGTGTAQALAFVTVFQAEFLGAAFGLFSTILALHEGNYAQTAFRGFTTVLGSFLGYKNIAKCVAKMNSSPVPPQGEAVIPVGYSMLDEVKSVIESLKFFGKKDSFHEWSSKVARIWNRDGITVSGMSAGNRESAFSSHPIAQDLCQNAPQNIYSGYCAEVEAVSNLLWILESQYNVQFSTAAEVKLYTQGAKIKVQSIRNNNSQSVTPCETCEYMLNKLGISYVP